VSTLTEIPAGRAGVSTHVVPTDRPAFVARTWERVRDAVAGGRQGFVVCARIGPDPDQDPLVPQPAAEQAGPELEDPLAELDEESARPARGVLHVAAELAAGPLLGLAVAVLHGKLPAAEKERVMARVISGPATAANPDGVDVLVATTVIEVGVDIPNAAVMVIVDADRFGMSQLHQLRGRIGRGAHAGLCLLLTDVEAASPAGERLAAVAATSDGFELARLDLAARREGDVLGVAQSGRRSSLRLLRVLTDEPVIARARELAELLVAADPALEHHVGLRSAVAAVQGQGRAEYLEKG